MGDFAGLECLLGLLGRLLGFAPAAGGAMAAV